MSNSTPGEQLYREVRAAFILRGDTLGNWMKRNELEPSHARQVLTGYWNGPSGQKLRDRIMIACDLNGITILYSEKEAS